MSDRESAESAGDEGEAGDEGLISRFWKAPDPSPAPAETPTEVDEETGVP